MFGISRLSLWISSSCWNEVGESHNDFDWNRSLFELTVSDNRDLERLPTFDELAMFDVGINAVLISSSISLSLVSVSSVSWSIVTPEKLFFLFQLKNVWNVNLWITGRFVLYSDIVCPVISSGEFQKAYPMWCFRRHVSVCHPRFWSTTNLVR